jgi:predicted transcriptional regulator
MPESNAPGAAGFGFGQGASFGFSDELSGAVSGLVAGFTRAGLQATKNPVARAAVRQMLGREDLPDAAVDDVLERAASRSLYEVTGFGGPGEKRIPSNPDDALQQGYTQARDAYRSDLDKAQANNPKAYLAGELAGAIASPGPKAAKGATGLAKAGQLAKAGAAYGAASGVGYGRAKGIEDPEQLLMEAGAGAGTGAVLTPAIALGGDKAGRAFRTLSDEAALKASGLRAGIGSQLDKRGYETADQARALGRAALDMELIRPGRTPEDVANLAALAKESRGARIEQALADADAAGVPFDTERAAWQSAGEVMGPNGLSPTAIRESTRSRKLIEDVLALPRVQDPTFANANRLKSDMYAGINFANDTPLKTKLEKRAASGLRKSIEDQVAETAGLDAADELRAANRDYGFLADIEPLAREEAGRLLEREPWWSAKGPLVAGAAAMAGGTYTAGPMGGAIGAALPVLGRAIAPRVPSAVAVGARGGANFAPRAAPSLARPATQQISQEEDDAIAAFLSGG